MYTLCSVVSDSWWPHGLCTAKLLCPWDFPDKNTAVGCHFLLQGIFWTRGSNPHLLCLLHRQMDSLPLHHLSVLCLVAQSCPTLCSPMDCNPTGFSVYGDSPGKNTGMGCHAPLQGIFSTQGLNPGLLHCKWILYHLSHQGSIIL